MALTASEAERKLNTLYSDQIDAEINGEPFDANALKEKQDAIRREFRAGLHERYTPTLSEINHRSLFDTAESMSAFRGGPGYFDTLEQNYKSLASIVKSVLDDALKGVVDDVDAEALSLPLGVCTNCNHAGSDHHDGPSYAYYQACSYDCGCSRFAS